jgi:rhodanese-related sulfurtransferase
VDFLGGLFGSSVPSISVTELQEKLKKANHPFLLDVREPEEFRDGHIAGAKLIPLGELRSRMTELPKDKEIICICASGSRSISATRQLSSAGYKVINMKGGMFLWQRAAFPVRKGTIS